MTVFIALVRGINVGGTGLLPMKDLVALCSGLGFQNVRTYIQSGNVIFESKLSAKQVCLQMEQALVQKMGKEIHVMVRTPAEMVAVLEANPFPREDPAKVAVLFLKETVPLRVCKERRCAGR